MMMMGESTCQIWVDFISVDDYPAHVVSVENLCRLTDLLYQIINKYICIQEGGI